MIFKHLRGSSVPAARRAGSPPYEIHRRGIALVMALVVMATLTVILAFIAKEIVSQRLAIEQRQRRLQAQWMARAGIEIAAARLLDNPDDLTLEVNDLLPDGSLHIRAEQAGKDEYLIAAEAQVSGEQNKPVAWSAQARYRRARSDDTTTLINVSAVVERVPSNSP